MRTNIFQDKYVSFNVDNYKDSYNSEEAMFSDIATMLKILTKNKYQCAFEYEDAGVYRLEFDHDNPEYGSPMIYWLDEQQLDMLCASLEKDEE